MSFPDHLILGVSTRYGTTVYTRRNLPKEHIICITEVNNFNKVDGHIITKYGNVFNNSDNPKFANCQLVLQDNDLIKIVALRDIEYGEELLVNYNNPRKDKNV